MGRWDRFGVGDAETMIKPLATWVRDRLPDMARSKIGRIGRFLGPQSTAIPTNVEFPSIEGSLICLRNRGFQPGLVVDVGAYRGEWTEMFRVCFPKSTILMVEAQEQKRPALEAIRERLGSGIDFRIALLGPETGREVSFAEMETGSSVYQEQSRYDRNVTKRQTVRLDDLVADQSQSVDFLKLDVQGYELEVLRGASKVLEQAQAVLMEASFVPVNQGAPLVAEVIRFMDDHGFQMVDFCSQIRRKDGVLWQTDLLFLRKGSPLLPEARLTEDNWG